MTHFENSDRTLTEHDTKVIWNRIDEGGPVAFKSVAQNAPRFLSRSLPAQQTQTAQAFVAQISAPHHNR